MRKFMKMITSLAVAFILAVTITDEGLIGVANASSLSSSSSSGGVKPPLLEPEIPTDPETPPDPDGKYDKFNPVDPSNQDSDSGVFAAEGVGGIILPTHSVSLDHAPDATVTAQVGGVPEGAMAELLKASADGVTSLPIGFSADQDAVASGATITRTFQTPIPEDAEATLAYWDEELGTWLSVPTEISTDRLTLTAHTTHFSWWAGIVKFGSNVSTAAWNGLETTTNATADGIVSLVEKGVQFIITGGELVYVVQGTLLGNYQPAPTCDGSASALPDWLHDTSHLPVDLAQPVKMCVGVDPEYPNLLQVKATSSRTYPIYVNMNAEASVVDNPRVSDIAMDYAHDMLLDSVATLPSAVMGIVTSISNGGYLAPGETVSWYFSKRDFESIPATESESKNLKFTFSQASVGESLFFRVMNVGVPAIITGTADDSLKILMGVQAILRCAPAGWSLGTESSGIPQRIQNLLVSDCFADSILTIVDSLAQMYGAGMTKRAQEHMFHPVKDLFGIIGMGVTVGTVGMSVSELTLDIEGNAMPKTVYLRTALTDDPDGDSDGSDPGTNPAPAPDLTDVVPDPAFKEFINRKLHYGGSNLERPISADSMARLRVDIYANNFNEERLLEQVKSIEGIQYATQLESLNLRLPLLTELPEDIGNLQNLHTLELPDSSMTTLPDSIGTMSALQVLNLSSDFSGGRLLTALPESFGGLVNLQKLDLSLQGILALPGSFGNLTNLQNLDLANTPLTVLPGTFGNLTGLRILNLRGSELSELPASVGSLKLLEELRLGYSNVAELPASFGELTGLHTLDVARTSLQTLPANFGLLKNLRVLRAGNIPLVALPESFGELISLEELDLGGTWPGHQLAMLPANFGDLQSLRVLNLESRLVTALPDSFGRLNNLTTLNLRHHRMESLPVNFGDLSQLHTLDLQYGNLRSLPESFGNLTTVESLQLNGNQLALLPDNFGNLTKLTSLALQSNRLTALPNSIGNLVGLQTVEIWANSLTTLPESFGNLQNLHTLDMSNNQLVRLPDSFGNLGDLKIMMASNNRLETLPASFGDLTNLEHLSLRASVLHSLPDSFGNLVKLKTLDLSVTQKLTSLPESFGGLVSLETLDLSKSFIDDSLKSLPESMGSLSALRTLNLSGNSALLELPSSMLSLANLESLDVGFTGLTRENETVAGLITRGVIVIPWI